MSYSTDLTDRQWQQICHLLEGENRGKHFREHTKRELLNAVLYLVKTGCQWRMLPNDFPKWQSVSSFYYRAKRSGLWEKIADLLVKKTRVAAGKNIAPSFCLIDSQSVKTVYSADARGFDGGKILKAENVTS